ncbi:MAG: hypothetical protein ABIJ34_08235 [archaeon]
MGTQYVDLLKQAKEKGGLVLATRVAMALGAGGDKASQVPDDPERITKAKEVISSA